MRLNEVIDIERKRGLEAESILKEIQVIENSTSEQKAIEERLLNERDPLSKAKQNLVIANAAVEKELEEQVTT
jgi:hypothetical protein